MEVSKSDWKLFRERVVDWQEAYMERLVKEYMDTIKGMDGLTDMLNAKVALSKEFAKDPDQFTSILKKKYTYVANQGYDAIPDKIEK